MANQTKYLKLNKPQIGTTGWGNAINNNFETLDANYGTLRANMSSIESRFAENSVYKFWYNGITIDGVEAKEYDYIYILLDGKKDITKNNETKTYYTSFHVCYATGGSKDNQYPLFKIPSELNADTGVTNNFHYSFKTDTEGDLQGLNQLDNFTSFYVIGTIDEIVSEAQENKLLQEFYIMPDFEKPSVYDILCGDDDTIVKVSVGDIVVMQRLVENNKVTMRPTKLSQALGYVYGWSQDQMNTNKITAHKVPVPVAQNEVSLYVPTIINKSIIIKTNDFETSTTSYTIDTDITTIGEYTEITVDKDDNVGLQTIKYNQSLANIEFFCKEIKETEEGGTIIVYTRAILDYEVIENGNKLAIQLINPCEFKGYCTYVVLQNQPVKKTTIDGE